MKSKIKNNEAGFIQHHFFRFKKQFHFVKSGAGFTLVELLASVIVLVAVGSIITGIISSSLRGANKTNTIENIRQNGNYALNQMAKDIEYTLPFDGKNTGLSNDGSTYDTSCAGILLPTPMPETTYKFITVQSMANDVTHYNCDNNVLTSDGISLIDTSSVSLTGCSIKCVQNKVTDIPIIKINFNINSGGLAEKSGSVTFETSVTIRNYKK